MKTGNHCFIEGKRPCTIKCMAAYESQGKTYCVLIWFIRQTDAGYLRKTMRPRIRSDKKR